MNVTLNRTAFGRVCRRAVTAAGVALVAVGTPQAQVPEKIYAGLVKIGQVVDPPCTAKLYRSRFLPKNDYNTYWPVGAAAPSISLPSIRASRSHAISRLVRTRKMCSISSRPAKGGDNRTVLIYVPGGAGNKIEQQDREANAFYDNIARWAAKNGMVGVLDTAACGFELGRWRP